MPAEPAAVMATIVDDEPHVVAMLVRAARSWGYPCRSAGCVSEALALFQAHPTPILVTDLNMPEESGTHLVEEVHRRWPRTAIIVVTGLHEYEAAIKCLNAGASRYFLKPIQLEEFRHVLASALHTYELQRERDSHERRLELTVRRQTRKLRQNFLATINSLVRALEIRDPYTSGHSRRVRHYSLLLADALGFEGRQRQCVGLAAKLHDLGKIGVPEAILNKPARLTDDEFAVVREHPILSERILAPVIRNSDVLGAIRGHHERMNGSGYPDGLAGDKIPLHARLLAIADCFDALTSARSYRRSLPFPVALDLLRDQAGEQYDPNFVRVFIDAITAQPPEEFLPGGVVLR